MPHNRPQTANCAACGCLCLPPPNRTCRLLLTSNPGIYSARDHCPSSEHANSNCQLRCDTKTCLLAGWAGARSTNWSVCLFSSSCAQGGAPAKVHLHMWVRVWLWARVERGVCVCARVDEMCGCMWGSRMIFTGTDSLEGVRVQACLRRAGSRASGMALSYRITQRLPEA